MKCRRFRIFSAAALLAFSFVVSARAQESAEHYCNVASGIPDFGGILESCKGRLTGSEKLFPLQCYSAGVDAAFAAVKAAKLACKAREQANPDTSGAADPLSFADSQARSTAKDLLSGDLQDYALLNNPADRASALNRVRDVERTLNNIEQSAMVSLDASFAVMSLSNAMAAASAGNSVPGVAATGRWAILAHPPSNQDVAVIIQRVDAAEAQAAEAAAAENAAT